ncbi:MAG TPA: chorismate lyase [Steroidobacteraceae bacterium]|nr:chorismate lyase [Steroidobacteraceae bacterium]
MSSAAKWRSAAIEWLPAERLGERPVDARLRPWLIGQGLLTTRLRASLGQRFELRLGDMWTGLLGADDKRHLAVSDTAGLFREDELCCDGRLWVLERTIMPDSTLAAHPWLAELGDSALGETLKVLSGVDRGAYEFAWLPADTALGRRALRGAPHAGLWARRSRISLRSAPLAVQELFLPMMGAA